MENKKEKLVCPWCKKEIKGKPVEKKIHLKGMVDLLNFKALKFCSEDCSNYFQYSVE